MPIWYVARAQSLGFFVVTVVMVIMIQMSMKKPIAMTRLDSDI